MAAASAPRDGRAVSPEDDGTIGRISAVWKREGGDSSLGIELVHYAHRHSDLRPVYDLGSRGDAFGEVCKRAALPSLLRQPSVPECQVAFD